MRHRVRHHEFLQLTLIQLLARVPAQNTMRDDGDGFLSAVLHHHLRSLDQRAARIGHVVDDDGDATPDVADEDHARDFVGSRSLFVDEREAEVKAVGY